MTPRWLSRNRIPDPDTPATAPPPPRPPRAAAWWIVLAALAVVGTAFGVGWWLLSHLPVSATLPEIKDPAAVASARNEIVRTALAAAAGVGAAITLALAFRRQRHAEIVADRAGHDATERRFTELYTKAVEQLGNDQAPVRLGGLYALERLAQDHPAMRQTIVDVICSYLRMPYSPPQEPDRHDRIRAARRAARTRSTKGTGEKPYEEGQVRLTAQRILATHLRYQAPHAHRWWQRGFPDANSLYWPGIQLDLSGAVLTDFVLGNCRVAQADFEGATFYGNAVFSDATFAGVVSFGGATFTGNAYFVRTTFYGIAWFDGAIFSSLARFNEATFHKSGSAWFGRATFSGDAEFSDTTSSLAEFDSATFAGTVQFGNARFEDLRLSGALVTCPSKAHVWPSGWQPAPLADGTAVLRRV